MSNAVSATARGLAVPKEHLRTILLGYLGEPCVTLWPGGDGLTVEEVLHGYTQAAAAHQVPCREELLALYPDLAETRRLLQRGTAPGLLSESAIPLGRAGPGGTPGPTRGVAPGSSVAPRGESSRVTSP